MNGEIDRAYGSIVGLNTPHRVEIAEVGEPGNTVRHRLPMSEWTAGGAAGRYLHALCDTGV